MVVARSANDATTRSATSGSCQSDAGAYAQAVATETSVLEFQFQGSSSKVPAPSEAERPLAKNQHVRKVYEIKSDEARWVYCIFDWFTRERQSIRWIVKELNRLKAPKDHRSSMSEWEHGLVVEKLTNEKEDRKN